jgi:hypothetical protein
MQHQQIRVRVKAVIFNDSTSMYHFKSDDLSEIQTAVVKATMLNTMSPLKTKKNVSNVLALVFPI